MSAKIRHQPTQRIGILVFEEFEPIDVWGFVESFAIARFMDQGYSDPSPYPFEIALISNESRPAGFSGSPSPVKSMNGPRVMPDLFREEALGQPFDVLMIPGGWGTRLLLNISSPEAEAAKTGLLQWVREMDARVGIMSSVCTGAAILAASGLLDGKPAATNHEAFAWVASFGPRVLWDNISRWVDSGHHVTSAGVSAGMDMGFYLVQRLAGRAVAENAVRSAEYEWTNTPRVRPALII